MVQSSNGVCLGLLLLATSAAPAGAQGTNCADFLHNRDGSWTSFTNDEMLLPRGPLPIHEGERFSRRSGGARGFVARILDDQCRLDSPDY